MSAGLTSLFFAAGVTAWVYNKFMRRTNHVRSSAIVAGLVGVIALIVFYTMFSFIIK